MSMAKEVGIDVPKIELLSHGNLAHYLINDLIELMVRYYIFIQLQG